MDESKSYDSNHTVAFYGNLIKTKSSMHTELTYVSSVYSIVKMSLDVMLSITILAS